MNSIDISLTHQFTCHLKVLNESNKIYLFYQVEKVSFKNSFHHVLKSINLLHVYIEYFLVCMCGES